MMLGGKKLHAIGAFKVEGAVKSAHWNNMGTGRVFGAVFPEQSL